MPEGVLLPLTGAARTTLGAADADAILTLIEENDYFALLAYLGPDDAIARELRKFRHEVRDLTRAATMFGVASRVMQMIFGRSGSWLDWRQALPSVCSLATARRRSHGPPTGS